MDDDVGLTRNGKRALTIKKEVLLSKKKKKNTAMNNKILDITLV